MGATNKDAAAKSAGFEPSAARNKKKAKREKPRLRKRARNTHKIEIIS